MYVSEEYLNNTNKYFRDFGVNDLLKGFIIVV
jgi:hypothetical protein